MQVLHSPRVEITAIMKSKITTETFDNFFRCLSHHCLLPAFATSSCLHYTCLFTHASADLYMQGNIFKQYFPKHMFYNLLGFLSETHWERDMNSGALWLGPSMSRTKSPVFMLHHSVGTAGSGLMPLLEWDWWE